MRLKAIHFLTALLSLAGISQARAEVLHSRNWEKIRLEERLTERATKVLGTVLKPKEFIVNVKVDLASPERGRSADASQQAETDSLGKIDIDPAFIDSLDDSSFLAEISQVTLTVYVEQAIPDARFEMIKTLSGNILGSLGKLPPVVSVEKMPLAGPQMDPAPMTPAELAREFKTPAAVVISTLILCLFIFLALALVFMGYSRIETRRLRIMETKEAREENLFQAQQAKQSSENFAKSGGTFGGGPAPAGQAGSSTIVTSSAPTLPKIDGVELGIDRIRKLIKKSPRDVGSLVKQWLKSPSGRGTNEALKTLSVMLSIEELTLIFEQLSESDKKTWRKVISESIDEAGIQRGNAYITSQIIEILLDHKRRSESSQAMGVLEDIKTSEAVEIANADPRLAGTLINLLPTQQVSEVFSKLSPDLANQIAVESLRYSDADLAPSLEKVKKILSDMRRRRASSSAPFVEKAFDMLTEVSPDKESALFSAIAESGDADLLNRAARTLFPSELILKLPATSLKAALDRMPLQKRAELILSRDASEKKALLEAYGALGSKSRELMEFEIQEISRDPARLKRIERQKRDLWAGFASITRALVVSDEASAEAADQVLSGWLDTKQPTGGSRAA